MRMHDPFHPGRILAYYLQGRSVTEVAKRLRVTRPALSRVLNGKAGVSADMALRIGHLFETNPSSGFGFRSSATYGKRRVRSDRGSSSFPLRSQLPDRPKASVSAHPKEANAGILHFVQDDVD